MGKLPPSPCRACGSKNHWNKECPHWNLFITPFAKDPPQVERAYNMAYQVLLSQKMVDLDKLAADTQQDFEEAVLKAPAERERKPYVDNSWRIEVVDDDDDDEEESSDCSLSPKDKDRDLEKVEEFWTNEDYDDEQILRRMRSHSRAPPQIREGLDVEVEAEEEGLRENETLIDPPLNEEPFVIKPHRKHASGCSAVGVSVLSMKGPIGSKDGPVMDQRLDSCANISLLSMEVYETLRHKLTIRTSKKMMLWQLTDKTKAIQGYCDLPLFVQTREGAMVETTVEVFLVPGMSVPLLLGEDYHINYELSVTRSIEEGTSIHFGNTKFVVAAQAVNNTDDWKNLRAKTYSTRELCAAKDYRIKAHSCVNVEVEGYFTEDEEFIVERGLLPLKGSMYLATPNVLLTPSYRRVPIMNPTDHPRMVRKGEIVGSISKADEFFDIAKNEEDVLYRFDR
ncbi:hypothetical protein BDZ89DRAFT_971889 [Hymenopellis radicata]|nr:hypothetical protein BDZ89DRAFT_971889 [Hymenopellis radicata]